MANRKRSWPASVVAIALLAGCASSKDTVIFVTKSSLALDVDGAPANASIGYDRIEGYFGPRFDNGSVPPVIAKISSKGSFLTREVEQYYATGTAANRLSGDGKTTVSEPDLNGEAEPMFFGTSSTLGLKVGFTTTVPDSFVFGYRRKETSLIPIGTTDAAGKKVRHYPSVIGVFATDAQAKTQSDSSFGLTQFFATGIAAETLAANPSLQADFQGFAADAVSQFKDASRAQQATLLSLLRCFTALDDSKLDSALDNADQLRLIPGAAALKVAAASDKQKARAGYVTQMSVVNVDPPDRSGRLEGHRVFVCGL